MQQAQADNSEQAKMWNGAAGRGWVAAQDILDHMLRPIEQRLVAAVKAASPAAVLDVGCGTGSTTLAVARALGPAGRTLGLDISEPMLGVARARAAGESSRAEFVLADAQHHALEPARFDMLVSRFGVMFFADPGQAFANLRRAMRAGGRLWFAVWRSPGENDFMTRAERVAAPLLPPPPAREPDAPGPFAFADPERLRRVLEAAGWTGVEIEPLDAACSFRHEDLERFLGSAGPVGRFLQEADAATRARILELVVPAFDSFVDGADVRVAAACWAVSARAGSG